MSLFAHGQGRLGLSLSAGVSSIHHGEGGLDVLSANALFGGNSDWLVAAGSHLCAGQTANPAPNPAPTQMPAPAQTDQNTPAPTTHPRPRPSQAQPHSRPVRQSHRPPRNRLHRLTPPDWPTPLRQKRPILSPPEPRFCSNFAAPSIRSAPSRETAFIFRRHFRSWSATGS